MNPRVRVPRSSGQPDWRWCPHGWPRRCLMSTDIIITERSGQARDVSATLGIRYGAILPTEGHLITLLDPEEVNPEWKRWSAVLLRPDGRYGTKPASGGSKANKLDAIRAALRSARRDAAGPAGDGADGLRRRVDQYDSAAGAPVGLGTGKAICVMRGSIPWAPGSSLPVAYRLGCRSWTFREGMRTCSRCPAGSWTRGAGKRRM